MLVLLIIFMITAPLLQVGVPVDLPKTSAQQVGGKDEPLVVSVNAKGEVFLGETKYELAELGAKLKAVHEEKPDQRVFMRGDKADRLRQDDGSDGRGDRQRLPPARPARRAGAAARQGRRRHRARRRPRPARAASSRRPRR